MKHLNQNFLHLIYLGFFLFSACSGGQNPQREKEETRADTAMAQQPESLSDSLKTYGPDYDLSGIEGGESVAKPSTVVGWPEGKTPVAPEGFEVVAFAKELDNPRWLYILPNGDVLVAESNSKNSADRITLLRDEDADGHPELRSVFLEGGELNRPFGMLLLNEKLYVANMDGILTYPYENGQTKMTAEPEKILDLPTGGYNHHWTRNIIASPDGSNIFVSVGSASNVGEYGMDEEKRRANILMIRPDGSGETIYASGLRNPVGMDWNPVDGTLWTAVNERDHSGNNLVPDYITRVQEGGFYGWPYAYFGGYVDSRHEGEAPQLVKTTLKPDIAMGAHTATLGMIFYDGESFPEKYHNGIFAGQHGSWNRADLAGYAVLFVPFENGNPKQVKPERFLTGFIKDAGAGEVYGRPVGVFVNSSGNLLVTDDAGNTIWLVRPTSR